MVTEATTSCSLMVLSKVFLKVACGDIRSATDEDRRVYGKNQERSILVPECGGKARANGHSIKEQLNLDAQYMVDQEEKK